MVKAVRTLSLTHTHTHTHTHHTHTQCLDDKKVHECTDSGPPQVTVHKSHYTVINLTPF